MVFYEGIILKASAFLFSVLLIQFLFIKPTIAQQPNPFGAQAPLAAGAKKKSSLNTGAVRVIYGSSAWNKDPKAIDSASVILREGATDKLVQIFLEESEPDSAVFSGLYSVRWENVAKLLPEFYVAPAELLGKNSEVRELKNLIATKKISRKPFILRRTNNQQIVEIYDTAEQARLAFKAFAAERDALNLANRKVISDATVDASQLAETAARRQANAKALQERIRIEQIEAQKRAARLKAFASLPAQQRQSQKTQAARLAEEALEAYKLADYKTAEQKFAQALELDPEKMDFYLQYGVTLYKLDESNRAIVFLNMAQETPQNSAERSYYLGLAFLKLEDYPNALTSFTTAAKSKHPDIGPSAQFYRGMILVDQKKFDEARTSFQTVLDTSKDPKLDEKAEEMIERLQAMKQFEREKAKRWSATALLGEMYDSNVLLINDTFTAGGATDLVGYRSIIAGGIKYRPVYDAKKEFAITVDALHIYTVDDNFKQNSTLRIADPTLLTITAPYTIKSVVFGRGNKLDIKPGYEGLMSSQESNSQKPILHSGFLTFDDTMILNDHFLGTAKLEVRYDSSQLTSSVGANDATAIKTKILAGALYFPTADRSKMVTGDVGFTLNAANGANVKYNRYDLSLGYIAPWIWDVTTNAKIAYYYLTYPEQSAKRTDHDVVFTLAGSKKINAVLTAGLTGNYTMNSSNSAVYDYSKYTVLATLSANWDF